MWRKARSAFKRSLTFRLIFSYLVILGIGGLVTSIVGSFMVSSTLLDLGRRTVLHDLTTARTIYQHQIDDIGRTVQLTASGAVMQRDLASGDDPALLTHLSDIRENTGLDFLTLTDRHGRVMLRTTGGAEGDLAGDLAVVRAALAGRLAASSEILPAERLAREDALLAQRAVTPIVSTRYAQNNRPPHETAGMVLIGAAPVFDGDGRIVGALYAGRLLNHSRDIVDRVWSLIYQSEQYSSENVGSVTIFQNDLRIATNVRTDDGERAVGTLASQPVRDAVLREGATWAARAFVVRDWYMSAYEPIRNLDGEIIGMLYVGLLESLFTATRDQVIISFFVIAGLGFLAIIITTYVIIRSMTRPLVEMAAATRRISAGEFDVQVRTEAPGEIGVLAHSFEAMLHSLRQMREDLEEWGRTLELRVHERTDELVAMQARVAESERLASVGMLAAGVAHEINNPMGGILALTSLSLEDLKVDDPIRSNLEEVVRQTERCRDIVKSLLEFSRQSQAQTELVDINITLRRTLALVANQALFHNIRIDTAYDADLPRVLGDPSQLEQVFMNIIVNAAQAMEHNGVIRIETLHREDLDQVETRISDNGTGIPPDRISRIFDPFFTTKESGHGTGLGLSIVYGVVTKHRGSISVESEVGHGTTFTIRFPLPDSVGDV
jgi:two-component system, NtrC family, sensor kinase